MRHDTTRDAGRDVSTQDPRALLAALHSAAVKGADPFARTREAAARWLVAHRNVLSGSGRIHLFGMGKAALAMTAGTVRAMHDLGLDPQHGIVVAGARTDAFLKDLPRDFIVVEGDHPVPGSASLRAANLVDTAISNLQPGDVAFVLLSGGTTSLTAAPVDALTQLIGDVDEAQAHVANLAETLLESGLAIHEMNAIRRRLLRFGAGRLAIALAERGVSRIAVFAISDVIGDDPAVIGSGPCSPDPLDAPAFLALLDAHDLRQTLQLDTAMFLGLAGTGHPPAVPPASHPAFQRTDYELVARNRDAVCALVSAARAAGITHVSDEAEPLEGEAATLGDLLARFAVSRARALPRSESALIAFGGEPVVNLRAAFERAWDDDRDQDADAHADEDSSPEDLRRALALLTGDVEASQPSDASPDKPARDEVESDEPLRGGRMQALALAAAFALEEVAASGDTSALRITLLAAGTDGRDGPTDAAGAIVDALTPALSRRAGRRPERDLATGKSWFPLNAADALLRTGPTGTNVMDVVAILIRSARS